MRKSRRLGMCRPYGRSRAVCWFAAGPGSVGGVARDDAAQASRWRRRCTRASDASSSEGVALRRSSAMTWARERPAAATRPSSAGFATSAWSWSSCGGGSPV